MENKKKAIILLVCVIIYLFIGALVFIAVESETHSPLEAKRELYRAFINFTDEHSSCGLTHDDLMSFVKDTVQVAIERGVFRVDADPKLGVQDEWSMANAILFTTSIVTTIGHGVMVPRTLEGRIVCLLYALFGVPLCYLMLAVVGETSLVLADKIDDIISCVHSRIILRNAARLFLIVFLFWMFVVTIPAIVYGNAEGWQWIQAQYFSFIEISTIGFGDVTPSLLRYGGSRMIDWCYKIGTVLYCFIALYVVSTIFKVLWRWRRGHFKVRSKRLRRFRCKTRSGSTADTTP